MEEIRNELDALLEEYIKKEQVLIDKLTREEREKIGRPLKEVHQLDTFRANGVNYIVRTSLTLARFEEFEKLQVRVGYGVEFKQLFANMRKAFDYLNESQPADAAIMLYNMMDGVKNKIDDRGNEVLDLCCLYICREGEDLRRYDPALNEEKKKDWREEGIMMKSFFSLASSLVNGFTPDLREASANISAAIETARDEAKSVRQKKST